MDSLDEPGEDVALLTAAGFNHGQQALDEATAGRRLCAERELAPDHGVPQCLLGAVVGRLHAFDLDEGPQAFAMFPQFLAEAVDALVVVAAQQVLFHLPADRFHPLAKGAAGDRPIAHFLPEGEHFLGRPHQVVAEAFADGTGAIDQSLEVAFQMSPAPLQAAEGPVHPRPVAVDNAGKIAAEQLPGHLGGPAGAAREKGEGVGDEGPDPTLVRAFLGRRFIDEQHGLGGELLAQFVVSGPHRFGGAVLQEHHPAGAGGLVENYTQELSGPAFGLAKAGHEQGGKGDQPRPGLPRRHAFRQFAAGGATAGAEQPVLLIFPDDRLDVREFPDLMADRLRIGSLQESAATPALGRHAGNDVCALSRRDQRPFVLRMPRLAATLAPRLGLGPRRLAVRVRGRGRLG